MLNLLSTKSGEPQTVVANLNDAFSNHKNELDDLSKARRRFYGLDVSSWIAVGTMEIVAASTGNIPLSIAAGLIGILGLPSAKDLWERGQSLAAKNRDLKRSPIGILFQHKKHR